MHVGKPGKRRDDLGLAHPGGCDEEEPHRVAVEAVGDHGGEDRDEDVGIR
jgi:hypothetical protein